MRVVHLNTRYARGGASVIAGRIHRRLLEQGVESTYVYGQNGRSAVDDPQSIEINSMLWCRVNRAMYRYFMKEPFTWGLMRLKAALGAADAIHLHNIHGFYLDYQRLFELLPQAKPVVWTLHDLWLITGRCTFPTVVGCAGYIEGCRTCPYPDQYPPSTCHAESLHFQRKLNWLGDRENLYVVVQSEWLRDLVAESPIGRQLRNPIRIIPNGIDTNLFRRNQPDGGAGTLSNKPVLFVADRLGEAKGFDRLCDIARNMPDVEFIAVGKSIGTVEACPSNIRCVGYVKPEVLVALYCQAGCYVLLSRADNYPTTVLEAIACQCPVIALRIGAVEEMLREGGGVVVASVPQAESAIRQLFSGDMRTGQGKVHSLDDMVGQYVALYNRVTS